MAKIEKKSGSALVKRNCSFSSLPIKSVHAVKTVAYTEIWWINVSALKNKQKKPSLLCMADLDWEKKEKKVCSICLLIFQTSSSWLQGIVQILGLH